MKLSARPIYHVRFWRGADMPRLVRGIGLNMSATAPLRARLQDLFALETARAPALGLVRRASRA
jgi:hypothetical protein